ncbi:MAG: 50S ribosomal protein L13 [Actinomycetota bacterium]
MKTYTPKAKEVQRAWYVVDADGAILGRLASEVAHVLRGKHKPTYAPHMDMGDHVIVVNAAKVRVTGAKATDKVYYHHSQYPGGLSEVPYERLAERRPERLIERAVRGMLPRNRLGRRMLRKLAVYAGADHPHQAQTPVPLQLRSRALVGEDRKES